MAFLAPGTSAARWYGLESRSQDRCNDLPYLERPTVPLAEALPRMLEKIETELATATEPAEEQWLKQRAELIRGLLPPRVST